MNEISGAVLDLYITGNYGEDQFRGQAQEEAVEDFSIPKLQDLKNQKDEIERIEKLILKEKAEAHILELEDHLAQIKADYQKDLARMRYAKFEESKFDKALKRKPAWIYKEGTLAVLKRIRTTRKVIAKKFIETWPFLAQEIAEIPVKKAEDEVGAKTLEPYCEVHISESFELISLEPE